MIVMTINVFFFKSSYFPVFKQSILDLIFNVYVNDKHEESIFFLVHIPLFGNKEE